MKQLTVSKNNAYEHQLAFIGKGCGYPSQDLQMKIAELACQLEIDGWDIFTIKIVEED